MTEFDLDLYRFDPENLFPLAKREEEIFSQRSKHHSKDVDQFLGFELAKVEAQVQKLKHSVELEAFETWSHLDPQIFLTPYLELRFILSLLELKPRDVLTDLGCAYARIPFVLNRHHPDVQFLGFDCVAARIAESDRVAKIHHLKNFHLSTQDVCSKDFELPKTSHFFIYDTGTSSDVERILEKIKIQVAKNSHQSKLGSDMSLRTLTARGARVKDIISKQHPWMPDPAHSNQNFSIYRF